MKIKKLEEFSGKTLKIYRIYEHLELPGKNYVIDLGEEGSDKTIARILLSSEEIEILHDAQICAEYPEKEKL